MTAFLYLQRFDNGQPASMPYADAMSLLARHGQLQRGRGDATFTFAQDAVACAATVVGDAAAGAACIGFERPRYDAALRKLVWACMTQLGCAVFDDALNLVYVPLVQPPSLPAALAQACLNGVRRIDSAQQLWPGEFEIASATMARPALRYTDAHGVLRMQFFDDCDAPAKRLAMDLMLHPAACNSATVRVLRNLELRVDDAVSASPPYHASYRYAHAESARQVLAGAPLGACRIPAPVSAPAEETGTSAGQGNLPGFVMDREVYASAATDAQQLTDYVQDKYRLTLDGSIASIDRLAVVLDKLHAFYRQGRATGSNAEGEALAMRWALAAGSYLGMVIVRQLGGQWGYVLRGEQRLLAVQTHRGALCFPHLQVLDHIVNRASDNVAQRLRSLAEQGSSACPRKDDFACSVPLLCKRLLAGADLPLADALTEALGTQRPGSGLDFSLASLQPLDTYLAAVSQQRDSLEPQAIARMALAVGAYLGEVVRNNAPGAGDWRWRNYADMAQADPGFAERLPFQPGLKAVLDGGTRLAYPLAQVTLALRGDAVDALHPYALNVLGLTAQ